MSTLPSTAKRIWKSYRLKMLLKAMRPQSLARHGMRRLRGNRKVVVIATPHKVGSTWWVQMLTDLIDFEYEFGMRRVPADCVDGNTELIDLSAPQTRDFLASVKGFRLFKSHSLLGWDALPPDVHVVTMHRDPRDAAVSLAFFLTNLHPASGGYDDEKRAWSIPQKLRDILSAPHNIERWEHWFRSDAPSFRTSYEAVKANPHAELTRCLQALDVDVSAERIEEVVDWHSFRRRSGRKPGQAHKTSFLRKGISGDWVNHFDEETVAFFQTVHEGRWNRLLIDMGYEDSADWSLPASISGAAPESPTDDETAANPVPRS